MINDAKIACTTYVILCNIFAVSNNPVGYSYNSTSLYRAYEGQSVAACVHYCNSVLILCIYTRDRV